MRIRGTQVLARGTTSAKRRGRYSVSGAFEDASPIERERYDRELLIAVPRIWQESSSRGATRHGRQCPDVPACAPPCGTGLDIGGWRAAGRRDRLRGER